MMPELFYHKKDSGELTAGNAKHTKEFGGLTTDNAKHTKESGELTKAHTSLILLRRRNVHQRGYRIAVPVCYLYIHSNT